MSDEEMVREFSRKVEELMRYTASAEAIAGLMPVITLAVQQTQRIGERDPELAPELGAVLDSLEAASQAAERAFVFASTRMSVRLDLEGDPPA